MGTPLLRMLGTLLLVALIFGSCGAGSTGSKTADKFAKDYGDARQALSSREAGQLLLKLVNAERTAHGLSQLALSAPASKLAKQHADDMAAYGYVGHYDLAGRKCELRYNLLGETDHVAENIDYREVGARARLTPELVRGIFADWIGSDRHRANLLDPAHTHMGYAFATHSSDKATKVYAVQEFVNDWGDYSRLPESATTLALDLSGRLAHAAKLAWVGIAAEAPPGPRLPKDVGEPDLHYRQPMPYELLLPGLEAPQIGTDSNWKPAVSAKAVNVKLDGSFSCRLHLSDGENPADLYVTVWATAPGLAKPFRAMTQVVTVSGSKTGKARSW